MFLFLPLAGCSPACKANQAGPSRRPGKHAAGSIGRNLADEHIKVGGPRRWVTASRSTGTAQLRLDRQIKEPALRATTTKVSPARKIDGPSEGA